MNCASLTLGHVVSLSLTLLLEGSCMHVSMPRVPVPHTYHTLRTPKSCWPGRRG